MLKTGATFSKVPRKILGKLLILILLLLHSFLLLRWTELIGLLVQCSTVALYPLDDIPTCVSVTPKIRSFPKIFLGADKNAAPVVYHLVDGSMVLLHIENSKNDRLKVILLCSTLTFIQTATRNITFSLSILLFSVRNNTVEPLTRW